MPTRPIYLDRGIRPRADRKISVDETSRIDTVRVDTVRASRCANPGKGRRSVLTCLTHLDNWTMSVTLRCVEALVDALAAYAMAVGGIHPDELARDDASSSRTEGTSVRSPNSRPHLRTYAGADADAEPDLRTSRRALARPRALDL